MMKEKESLFFDFILLKGKYKGFGRVKTFRRFSEHY